MTVAAAETTVARTTATRATATRATPAGRHARTGSGAPARGRSARPGANSRRPAPLPPPQPAQRQRPAQGRKPAKRRTNVRVPGGQPARGGYQPVILAEFIAAILLTAATPFAASKDKAGLSPYAGKDLMKLVALTVLYLILALISTGGRGPGRISAWFGGLVLIAVGLGEAATIAKVLDIFGTGSSSKDGGTNA